MEGTAGAHVVVVEDEPVTRALFVAYLEAAGFRVSAVEDGASLRRLVAAEDVDLVLLDVELPGEHGFQVGAALRATTSVGLIFVTRRADVVDRVVGLEIGADDYVTKPPEMRELLARVRAVLRRRADARAASAPPPRFDAVTRVGSFALDRQRRCLVRLTGEEVAITQGELSILDALVEAEGRVVPREALAAALAGSAAGSSQRSLDVVIHRLRRKLGEGGVVEPRILLTVHGVGYRLKVGAH
jgi:two-component system torCAD operon response regulator TorR